MKNIFTYLQLFYRKNNVPRGFTFVEIASAILILGVMSVSVMNMYSFASRTNALAEENLRLTNLFQYKIEELTSLPFSKDVTAVGTTIAPFNQYLFDLAQEYPYLSNPYLKRIIVVCRYVSVLKANKTESVSFLVANMPN